MCLYFYNMYFYYSSKTCPTRLKTIPRQEQRKNCQIPLYITTAIIPKIKYVKINNCLKLNTDYFCKDFLHFLYYDIHPLIQEGELIINIFLVMHEEVALVVVEEIVGVFAASQTSSEQ